MTTARDLRFRMQTKGTAHATHKLHIFNPSGRCRDKSLTPSTECGFFANAHYSSTLTERWSGTHPPLLPTRNTPCPPKTVLCGFLLVSSHVLSAETRTVFSSINLKPCVARLGVDVHVASPVKSTQQVGTADGTTVNVVRRMFPWDTKATEMHH